MLLLPLLAACAASRPTTGVVRPSGRGEARFTILQINDVYRIEGLEDGRRGGLARVRALRRELESRGQAVLVLHGGDALFPSVMSKYFQARPMVEMLNLLDGDPVAFDPRLVAVFGNHEFDVSDPAVLLGRLEESRFLWLGTNIRFCPDGVEARDRCPPFSSRVSSVRDVAVVEVGGVRVGLFGMTIPEEDPPWIAFEGFGAAGERRKLVRAALAELRAQGARVVIALTHQDLARDVELAREFPEIDLVAGGHEHSYHAEPVGWRWVAKADADAISAVVWEVRVPETGPVEAIPHRRELGSEVAPDPEVAAAVGVWMKALEGKVPEPFAEIATTEHPLDGTEAGIRSHETALGNFLADVMRERMAAEIALFNGGAVRLNEVIPAGGSVRNLELEAIFYFNNDLVRFDLSGAELLELLRTSVSDLELRHGRFLHVAGLRFGYRRGGTARNPVFTVAARDVTVNGEPLDLARRYRAATIDWLWQEGWRDGYTLFSRSQGGRSPERNDPGERVGWRAASEAALRALPGRRIQTAVEGRIQELR